MLLFLALPASAGGFRLSENCPPGFERLADDVCRMVTLYDQYGSLRGRGVGGTRTGLPPRRDGFTAQQIDLGRYLFFDPILSADGSVSCASCHDPALGLADGRGRSTGLHGETLSRGAPTLWNSAFLSRFFWDARAESLEAQLPGPLYAAGEMGNNPDDLLAALRNNAEYPALFRAAFGAGSGPIDTAQVYTALAAFEASLISLNSRYDRYAHGDHNALDAEEIAGLNVFRSFVARCAECHTPPLFTNQQVAVIGTPEPEGLPRDIGAQATFGSPKLRGAFKVPTLRNIARTAPYMHSGRFETLAEVVAFYNDGRGHAVPEDEPLQLHWHIVSPELAAHELDQLVAFLGTLTDERFLPRVPTRVPSGLTPGGRSARAALTPTGEAP
ncbi:Cytochrome c551 peroxidase [Pseudohaliea rubra DSM 19751]|uniref:Cytochrome c551 peroxidase n=2 Tax=Pseudohaliea TaxID=1341120 RepID=A0A095WXF8_9GAMM|nr:Cytochrome c551 peroxidase [Pseudohaliea rubra DSM 19751]